MGKENNQKWYLRIVQSKWLVLILSILIVVVNAIVQAQKKDWTWVLITISVLSILLIIIILLSFLMRKEREDIMQSIIQEDGLLNNYLQEKIGDFNGHGTCLQDVQKECKERMKQILLKPEYEKMKLFDIDEILEFERKVQNGEIWNITDELYADVKNKKVFDTIISNLQDGTTYKYFHTVNASDAKTLMETELKKQSITDIDKKVIFTQVVNKYDALLTITKDVIILNPNDKDRRAFVCIYTINNILELAFYRELDEDEIEPLCIMIRENSLTKLVSQEDATAFSKLQNQLDEIIKKSKIQVDTQTQYIEKLNQNPGILNEYIENKRSGELENPNYYAALQSAANSILKEKHKAKDNYTGEIWALSLCLSNEWNEGDECEKKWLDTLLQIDKQGIKTKLLYIFNDETLGLNPFDDKGKILLEQIDIYCSGTTLYKNTQSYAISKSEIEINDDTEFERGFFALNLEDKRTFLIYDVAEENKETADRPQGEIDYDNARKKNIHEKWKLYIEKAKTLNQYLQEKSDERAIEYMKSKNFDI